MNYALTVYPLSTAYRRSLETALAAEPVYLSLADFRRLPLRETLSRLRGLQSARLVLALEDENSRPILPVLLAVAALSNAASIEVRFPDLRVERISRWSLLKSLAAVACASVASIRDAATCWRELGGLLRAPRITASLEHTQRAVYLNANLWFGVKAGGSIGHVAGVVNAMQERNCEVLYASAGGRTMINSEVEGLELRAPEVFGFPPELNQNRFHRTVVNQLSGGAPPDFIYQRMSIGNYSGVTLSRRWGVPLILEYNGSEVWIAKHWGRPLRFEKLAQRAEDVSLKHAHVIVTISDVLRDELIGRGVPAERIVSYPNCIDPAVFDPTRFSAADATNLRRKLGVAPDAVLATFVGTFGQWHGADVLAQAIKQLAETRSDWLRQRKLHFVLVGDGLKMPVVHEILAGVSPEFFTLTGLVPQKDAPAYLAAADILLSPHVGNTDGSRFFGSPTKLFEYMAMGKAIVASDLEQIGEILRNSVRAGSLPADPPASGDTRLAVLFEPGDVVAMIESITFAVNRPEWRARLGQNARAEALDKYTWPHHVSAILERLTALTR